VQDRAPPSTVNLSHAPAWELHLLEYNICQVKLHAVPFSRHLVSRPICRTRPRLNLTRSSYRPTKSSHKQRLFEEIYIGGAG
jgi:hypothetical protein